MQHTRTTPRPVTPVERFILSLWPGRHEFPLPTPYRLRLETQFSAARDFADCLEAGGRGCAIGTSEHGTELQSALVWLLQLDAEAAAEEEREAAA